MRKKPYYYLTAVNSAATILDKGILANPDGLIPVFTKLTVANWIAKRQRSMAQYSLFAILPEGVTGPARRDKVADLSARWQRLIDQPVILPQYLKHLGDFDTTEGPAAGDYLCLGSIGFDKMTVDMIYAFTAQFHANKRRMWEEISRRCQDRGSIH